MKFFKTTLVLALLFLATNCSTKVEGSSEFHPDFKIAKSGFKKELKKEIDFEDLSIGTYYTKKNNITEERGLNLTFKNANQEVYSTNEANKKADFIATQVNKYLLNLDNYDYVNIIFENENEEGDVKKSTRITIKREL
ncbi:hypothetical protein [Polaribacter sp. MED152]|uniref:hypothetical protein n=1 Tax=Polaribacter sp. MED152 TaxID=313598 RepID=UPI0000689A23|nr:hypothetical protein [Polaribacter sp. MED152]EAQ40998.1 hypothetical protein MED152_13209 [Polaribacter sp. MED152]